MASSDINKAIMKMSKRSEKADIHDLVSTFVDAGPLFTLLNTVENQIIFGRRGTGKTHALTYLAEEVKVNGDIAVFIDLSNLGSSGGIYSDGKLPTTERASRLLVDTLSKIHTELFSYFVNNDDLYNLSLVGKELDAFADSISTVRLSGGVESEYLTKCDTSEEMKSGFGANLSKEKAGASISLAESVGQNESQSSRVKCSGDVRHVVHFGSVRSSLEKILEIVKPKRLWVILDEWSSVPLDLQPFLADLFRRCFFPMRNLTAKIGAIEYRSHFKIPLQCNDYIGFELGADAAVNIDLDEFMVFDNNPSRSRMFFGNLFLRHLSSSEEIKKGLFSIVSQDDMINQAFSQRGTFDELVRAAEGVPRDAIYIAALAAQYAFDEKISIPDIRKAARNWYAQGKESSIAAKETAHSLLLWIVDKVIGERKARAFLLEASVDHDLIRNLFDSRVLHVLKKNISSREEPGKRYTAYKLDYGCYVELINTSKSTVGHFQMDDGSYIDVPPDDYRAIRRAVLDLDVFLESLL